MIVSSPSRIGESVSRQIHSMCRNRNKSRPCKPKLSLYDLDNYVLQEYSKNAVIQVYFMKYNGGKAEIENQYLGWMRSI